MQTKLTTFEQLDKLTEGNLITRFPAHGAPEDKFDERRKMDIDTYEIIGINRQEQLVKLIRADEALEIFTWPRDIERLNIGLSNILSEKTWWVA